MADGKEYFQETLKYRVPARSLLENFNDTNAQPIERPLLQPWSGSVLTTSLCSPTVARSVTSVDTDATAVNLQLRNLFPTVWKGLSAFLCY